MINFALEPNATLLDAVKVIEDGQKTIAVVVDEFNNLLGALTDGDIRRSLLNGHTLNDSVVIAMNINPLTANANSEDSFLLELLIRYTYEAIPLVDSSGKFKRIVHISDLSSNKVTHVMSDFYAAVIMAGGEGRRLLPLTQDVPKPMIQVGGMPIIERQIRCLARQGVEKIFITINYLGQVIKEYFKSGEDFGVQISYLHEDMKLGTGGALSLLPTMPDRPLLVINGDVLTTFDYKHCLDFHQESKAFITVAAITHHVEIPYGVIHANNINITKLEEKPSQKFLCNAGIYTLSPEAISLVPRQQFFNMTDLIELGINQKKKVVTFPIHEYWTDIGTPAELERARNKIFDTGEFRGI